MNFDDVILTRRSIRKFKDKRVEQEAIDRLIEIARLTPSAKNRQPWFFRVLEGEQKNDFCNLLYKKALELNNAGVKETARAMKESSVVILVFAQRTDRTDLLSIGAAMYSISLKATDLCLGSLWVGDTDVLTDLPGYERLVGAMAVGYADEFPPARPRKTTEQISNIKRAENETETEDLLIDAPLQDPFAFVSYSHKDSSLVVKDVVELKRHGVPLWYDKALEYGEKWNKQALGVLAQSNCTVFVLYVSLLSLSSPAVFQEFSLAFSRKKKGELSILPVLIGEDSVFDILTALRKNKLCRYAKKYEKFFDKNEVLFQTRSRYVQDLTHILPIVQYLESKKIIANTNIYDVFHYEIKENACVITGYDGFSEDVSIPSSIAGFPVVEIGKSAFAENTFIRRVVLPNGVKKISDGAFRRTSLENISMPDSVEELCQACFRGCARIKRIDLPPKIKYLSEALFRECVSLEEIDVPVGVTEMKEAVFNSCSSLKTVRLPDTLKKMTEGGFFGCKSLETLIIPPTVEGVEQQSFDTCPLLCRVVVGGFVFEKGTVKKI